MTEEVTEEKSSQKEKKKKRGPQGKPIISPDRCKGCGFCVEFCPTDVLGMSSDFNAKGYHYPEIVDAEACTACDLCGLYCPDFAIYVNRFKKPKKKTEDK